MSNVPTRLLYGPGPGMVEPAVYQAMARPLVGHLDPYFFEVVGEVRNGLRAAFGTSNELTLAVSGTGSSGMETAVANLIEPGTRLGVFSAGFFAERIAEMGRRHGAEVVEWKKPWGSTFGPDEAAELIDRHKPEVVAFVHAETSTGALQPPAAICKAAREAGALVIADTVTSLGATEVAVDANGIDVAYSCSQKGLSMPPGLAPITVSPRAMERIEARKSSPDVWYLDLKLLRDYYDGRKYHHTASATLFYAMQAGLAAIAAEGLENRWARHRSAHDRFVAGIEAMGLQMHVPAGSRIPNLNTPRVPEGVDDAKVRARLLSERGIEIAGGFGPLAGKIFRVGVMGPLATAENVDLFLAALGEAISVQRSAVS